MSLAPTNQSTLTTPATTATASYTAMTGPNRKRSARNGTESTAVRKRTAPAVTSQNARFGLGIIATTRSVQERFVAIRERFATTIVV